MRWWCAATTAPWDWTWRPYLGVWVLLVAAAVVYRRGRPADGRGEPAARWFWAGLFFFWLATDWPIGGTVVIGAPDHWHVPMTVDAVAASKDVYVEKPISHTIAEGERVEKAVLARVRSTRDPSPARLRVIDGAICVVFDAPEEGVSPGQACVLYDPETPSRVLGGGFIASTVRADLALSIPSA